MTKLNKSSVFLQTLSDAKSESFTGGAALLLPAIQASREVAKFSLSINSKNVGELDRIKAEPT